MIARDKIYRLQMHLEAYMNKAYKAAAEGLEIP